MPCPSCAAHVPDGSKFCPNCGQLLVHTEERRIVSVLFADLVGFTHLAEDRDPEQLKHLIDRCFQRLVADITSFGGTVDKIIGDAIVALFGAPTAHEDDPERAVRAALRMQRTLAAFADENGSELQMRVGVNTGEVLVGALRAGGDYTAMGDTVNIASRLQASATPGEVLVGPETYRGTEEAIRYEARGEIALRGRDEAVATYAALTALAPPGRRRDVTRAPLVGRNIEHLHLTTAIDSSIARSRAVLVNVLGEAGMGKTRLAEEVAASAEATHDAMVLEGRVLPYGEINPLRAIGDAIADAAGVAVADSAETAETKVTALVQAVLGPEASETEIAGSVDATLRMMGRPSGFDALEANRRQTEVREGIKRFFRSAAARRPVVLIIGDIHWADDRLLNVVEFLLRAHAGQRFVVIATARWTMDEQRWVVPPGRHNTVVLNLDPLDRGASARLVNALVGEEVPETLTDQMYDRSGGNPFFLEEIASLLKESGVVGSGVRVDDEERSVAELPDTLRGLVAARLDALTTEERAIVENASVLGRGGPIYALQLMQGPETDERMSTFRRLVDKDIFTTEGERWRFRSDLVRDVAYSMLTRTVRAEKHYEVAEWLTTNAEDPTGGSVGMISDHFGSAAELASEIGEGDLPIDLIDRAVEWLGRAGAAADEHDSHYVAAQRFHRAIDLLKEDDPRLVDLLIGRSRARLGLRELTAGRADADRARRLALDSDQPLAAAKAMRLEGEIVSAVGDNQRAAELLDGAITELRALQDEREAAEALRLRGMVALFSGDAALADSLIDEAYAIFDSFDDNIGLAWCLQNLAWISFEQGYVEEAEERLHAAVALFTELDDLGGLAFANGLMAYLRFHEGDNAEAEALASQVRELARDRGERFGEAMMDLLVASIQLWSGRVRSAITMASEARAVFGEIESAYGVVQSLGLLGRAHAAVGNLAASRAVLEESRQRAAEMPGNPLLKFTRLVAAGGAIQVGDPDTALEMVVDLDPVLDEQRIIGSVDLEVTMGLALLQQGQVRQAVDQLLVVETVDGAPTNYLDSSLALALVAAGDLLGAGESVRRVLDDDRATYLDRRTALLAAAMVEVRKGEVAAATARFDEAVAMIDATESRMSQAVVRLAQAIGHEAMETSLAPELRLDAERALDELGMHPAGWERAFRLAAGADHGVEFATPAD